MSNSYSTAYLDKKYFFLGKAPHYRLFNITHSLSIKIPITLEKSKLLNRGRLINSSSSTSIMQMHFNP